MTAATVTLPAVCLDGVAWCTSCDRASDGTMCHQTTLTASELVDVGVYLWTEGDGVQHDPTFQIAVHDEPPLTRDEVRQVVSEILLAVASMPTHEVSA